MAVLGLLIGLVGGVMVWVGLKAEITPLRFFGVVAIVLALVIQLRAPLGHHEVDRTSDIPVLQGAPVGATSPTPSPTPTKASPKPTPSPSPSPVDTSSTSQYTKAQLQYYARHQSPTPKPT